MNGLHIPDTPIVVDYWRQKDVPPRALFFLTHMHAGLRSVLSRIVITSVLILVVFLVPTPSTNHHSGLTASWSSTIYCTPITRKLLIKKLNVEPSVVEELEVGGAYHLKVDCPGDDSTSVCVTVLDANHCPGAAMFLFEGYFGTILYTGDFRYSPDMAAQLTGKHIDVLYMDNTYCHESCVFPSREEAGYEAVELIRRLPEGTRVLIGLHYVGKEELLGRIGMSLRRPIQVDEERLEVLRIVEARDVFTTEEADILVCAGHNLTEKKIEQMNLDTPTIGILPTCLYIGLGAPPPPSSNHIRVIPYSDHSSFRELWDFVCVVRPRRVYPLVRWFTGGSQVTRMRTDMSVFSHLLDPSPASPVHVPPCVQRLLTRDPGALLVDPPPRPKRRKSALLPTPPPLVRLNQQRPMGVHYLSPVKSKATPPVPSPPTNMETDDVCQDQNDIPAPPPNSRPQDGCLVRGPPALWSHGSQGKASPPREPPPLLSDTRPEVGVAALEVGVVKLQVGVVRCEGGVIGSGCDGKIEDVKMSEIPTDCHTMEPVSGEEGVAIPTTRSNILFGGVAGMLQISKVESCTYMPGPEWVNSGSEGVKPEAVNSGSEGVKPEAVNSGSEGVKPEWVNNGPEGVKPEWVNNGPEGVNRRLEFQGAPNPHADRPVIVEVEDTLHEPLSNMCQPLSNMCQPPSNMCQPPSNMCQPLSKTRKLPASIHQGPALDTNDKGACVNTNEQGPHHDTSDGGGLRPQGVQRMKQLKMSLFRHSLRGAEKLPPRGAETLPPRGTEAIPPRGTETLPPRGAETLPHRGTETLPPRGAETLPPRGTETLPPRGAETLPPRGTEALPPRGAETLPPRGAETLPPWGAEIRPPRGAETLPPRGTEIRPPRGAETLPPRGAETLPPRRLTSPPSIPIPPLIKDKVDTTPAPHRVRSPGQTRFKATCNCASGGVCWAGLEDLLLSPSPHHDGSKGFLDWL